MIVNVLVLSVVYKPSQTYANIVTKPMTITAKKVAKDLAVDSAVAMAEHIIFEKMMNDFINGEHGDLDDGYSPVCLTGQNVKDCPSDKMVQVKNMNSTDKKKLSKTVETVIERKTNTGGFNKFLDWFIPIFLVSGLVEFIKSSLDGDSQNLIDDIAMESLIESGLMKGLQKTIEVPLSDFSKVINSISTSYSFGLNTVTINLNGIQKADSSFSMSIYGRHPNQGYYAVHNKNFTTETAKIGISINYVRHSETIDGIQYYYVKPTITDVIMDSISYSVQKRATLHETDPIFTSSSEAKAYAENWILSNVISTLNTKDVNTDLNNLFKFIRLTDADPTINVPVLPVEPVQPVYTPQSGVEHIKNDDGTITMKGIDSFTYVYNNTYVYPSLDSTTGWKDKTTGEDITVIEDDILVNPDEVPTEDEEEEPISSCGKEMKLPDFEPIVDSFTHAFPFSIPWDIKRFIDNAFSGIGDERPRFELSFLGDGVVIEIPEYFDRWVAFGKGLVIIAFDIGILFLFYRFMKGGGD